MVTGEFIHRAADGTETGVADGVQALYDIVISSMDRGSGFWCAEDAEPVGIIGHLGGFGRIDEVDRYLSERRQSEEAGEWVRDNMNLLRAVGQIRMNMFREETIPHDHVFSTLGKCM